ncbi:MAG: 2-C-methyl-D-erythritol 2,4-cyclodiphosphate synthase [Fusobacterium sp. JB019]|nr:2-C-methyl-D-erythritol 2,4-cyclodiphosphate synthase [Fusobacterium sp. JB020]MDP0507012.1 2-C-methyl-D-erythritol 2,4-cyclodiphosphate synthase [Fusobacterium sp. JB019]
MIRIGNGYDVHRFKEGRKLILGGVEIPYKVGLLGHSDADVLLHAIIDAILGALALGDIGQHFPDNNKEYLNIDSKILLKKVKNIMDIEGYEIGNLDSIIVTQKPKLKNYLKEMRKNISEILKTEISNISVKATTEENLGFTGREEGIKSYCVLILNKKQKKKA